MTLHRHFRRLVPLLALAAMLWSASGAEAQRREPEPARIVATGQGWRLVDVDPGGGTGLNTMMWEVSEGGVANVPVTQAQRDMLNEAFADDPEDPGGIIFVSQELLQAMEQPDFPAGYEPYIEQQQLDSDVAAEGQQAGPSRSLSLCGWGSSQTKSRSFTFSELDIDRDFEFDGDIDGHLRLNLPLQGQADVTATYKIRKCFGIPTGFKFQRATAVGNAAMNGSGSLDASAVFAQQYEKEWDLGEPNLGEISFTIYGFPVRIKFTLPLYAGVTLDARVAGTVSAQIDATAAGTFNYSCTLDDCSGSSDFTDTFDITGPTGSVQVDLKAAAHARVMVRAALYNKNVAYVEGGLKPYVQAGIWGYYGNNCGDANGDGQNETVQALAADLRWGYKFAYSWGALGNEGDVHYSGGNEYLLAWRDLLGAGGSTALQPMLVGPSSVVQGEPISYVVRMRPCYPYSEAVNFTITPGTWSGGTVISSPPFGGPTIQSSFPSAGNQTLVLTATKDAGGRDLQNSSSRVLAVTQAVPATPTGLAASVLSSSAVRLDWTDNSTNETGFEIHRRPLPSGSFSQLTLVAANATTYTNSGLTPNTGYEYRVRARNGGLQSGWSNVVSATTSDIPPTTPTGLAATVLSATSVRLSWTDTSNNETQFDLQRRLLPSGGFAAIANPAANTTSFTDNGAAAQSSYEYRVRARNAAGTSNWSAIVSATTPPPTPGTPTNLAAVFNFATRAIRLTWTDNSANETGFNVQFSFNGSAFADMSPATVGANVTLYVSGQNPPPGSYQFRVRSFNGSAYSVFSNVASLIVTPPPPAAGYQGCYTDSSTRALPAQLGGTTHTIETCKQAAYNAGYRYAGLQYYGYCFGGNTLGYTLVADSQCNTPCSSNAGQMCGGAWRNSIYDTGYVPPNPAATSIAWIQPAESSWGPAGTLTAAGYATNGTGGVQLVWRERSSTGVWGPWTTVAWQPPPSPDTTWSNTISSGNPTNKCHWFDAYTNYSGATSPVFHYTGAPGCP